VLSKEQIEQAAKEHIRNMKFLHDIKDVFIAGAKMVNERQPYMAEDMQEYLNFVLKIIKECQDLGMSFSEKYDIKSDHKLLKLWEEQRNG
jgi:hypothetical protein